MIAITKTTTPEELGKDIKDNIATISALEIAWAISQMITLSKLPSS